MATTLRDEISAKNRADVEAQTAPDQMWQSMSNQYDQKAKQIQQGYDRAYSTADNQLLSRGMGRSSYGGQVLANISKQGVDAQTQNHNDLIAAYQNWLANYNTQQEQFQWQKDSADRQIALGFLNNIAANGGNPSDELLARAGISRGDFNAMSYQAPSAFGGGGGGGGGGRSSSGPGSTPAWKAAGFASEAEYKAALALGYKTKAAYDAYLSGNKSALELANAYNTGNTGGGSGLDIMGAIRNGINSVGNAVSSSVSSIPGALTNAINNAKSSGVKAELDKAAVAAGVAKEKQPTTQKNMFKVETGLVKK